MTKEQHKQALKAYRKATKRNKPLRSITTADERVSMALRSSCKALNKV